MRHVSLFDRDNEFRHRKLKFIGLVLVPGPVSHGADPEMSRKGLMEQDLSKLHVGKLHLLVPEVISWQATISIGMQILMRAFSLAVIACLVV